MTTTMTTLTPEELGSLHRLAKGPLVTEVPPQHILKLSNLGLIVKVRIEYKVTEVGRSRLTEKHIPRPSTP
jgi:hypothetical protein